MSRRAFGAGLCALAAVAFLLAAFLPWFESRRAGDDDDDDRDQPRASYQLQGGERCEDGRCRDLRYTGGRGLEDELFAVLGWTTLAGALGTVALAVAVAAARRRHRPLRAWAATSAAVTAGLGAMFVASETISRQDNVERGWGLAALTVGAIVAGVGLAFPAQASPPGRRTERRWLPGLLLVGGAAIAWLSLTDHGWWRGIGAFRAIAASPLGREVCDGEDCESGALALSGGMGWLARLAVALTAAVLVPAFGAAARIVQGRAAGAWGVAAALLAVTALAAGAGVAALPRVGTSEGLAWGFPAFAAAMAAVTGAALIARRWITAADDDADHDVVPALPARSARSRRGAPAVATPRPAFAAHAPGAAKPVLAALGAPVSAPPSTAPASADAAPEHRYGPRSAPPAAEVAPNPFARPVADAHPPSAAPSPYAPRPPTGGPSSRPVAHGRSEPAWVGTPREQFVPPRPGAGGPLARGQVVTPPPLARRASPTCPSCRQPTLWHGKRTAWWCSACKRAL